MARFRLVDAALATGSALALLVSALAVAGYSPLSHPATRPVASPSTSASEPASPTTPTPSETPTSPEASTTDEGSTPVSSSTPTPSYTPLISPDRAANVLVLGDANSDESDEWVTQLAQSLGKRQRTVLHQLRGIDPVDYADPITTGEGSPVTIWNASLAATDVSVSPSTLKNLAPEAPGVVLISWGRTQNPDTLVSRLNESRDAVKQLWPEARVFVVLPPVPLQGQLPETRAALDGWAKSNSVPTIDGSQGWTTASVDPTPQVSEQGAVTTEGHRLWAATVESVLTSE